MQFSVLGYREKQLLLQKSKAQVQSMVSPCGEDSGLPSPVFLSSPLHHFLPSQNIYLIRFSKQATRNAKRRKRTIHSVPLQFLLDKSA